MSSHTSPTARYLPSELKATELAAFIRSRAVHVLEVGESSHSPGVDVVPIGDVPISRKGASPRLRASANEPVGVRGLLTAEELRGTAVGRALKNCCDALRSSSSVVTTAVAPATYAKDLVVGELLNPATDNVEVPTIFSKDKPDAPGSGPPRRADRPKDL